MFLLKVGRWFLEVFMLFRFRLCSCLKVLVNGRNCTASRSIIKSFSVTTGNYIKIPAFSTACIILHVVFEV